MMNGEVRSNQGGYDVVQCFGKRRCVGKVPRYVCCMYIVSLRFVAPIDMELRKSNLGC